MESLFSGNMTGVMPAWLLLVALGGYLLGSMNGAIITSGLFYHDDIREHGSGNAGLTNFYRTYGGKHIALVLLIDMGKGALAVLLGALFFSNAFGRYFAGFFCLLGHMFPAYYHFKGGKGVLCCGMILLLLDWRLALVCWGAFLLAVVVTRYVSLGSVCAAAMFPVMTYHIYSGETAAFVISILMAGLVIWAHRGNIDRLLHGTESKFKLYRNTPKEEKKP